MINILIRLGADVLASCFLETPTQNLVLINLHAGLKLKLTCPSDSVLLQPHLQWVSERRLNTLEIRCGAKTGIVHEDKTPPTVVPHSVWIWAESNRSIKVKVSRAIAQCQIRGGPPLFLVVGLYDC